MTTGKKRSPHLSYLVVGLRSRSERSIYRAVRWLERDDRPPVFPTDASILSQLTTQSPVSSAQSRLLLVVFPGSPVSQVENTSEVRGGNHPPVEWPDPITKWLSWSRQPAGASGRIAKRDKKQPPKLTSRLYPT